MRRLSAIAVITFLGSGSACTAALEADLKVLRQQLRELSRQTSASQVRQEELSNRLAVAEDALVRGRTTARATPSAPATSPKPVVVNTQEPKPDAAPPSTSAPDAPESLPVVRLGPNASGAPRAIITAAEEPAPSVAPAPSPAPARKSDEAREAWLADLDKLEPKPLYARGLAAFRAGNLDAAVRVFAAFAARFPNHSLADNALYWTGRAQARRGDNAAAIRAYQDLLRRYPTGNKVPDALLALADSHAASGQSEEARTKLTLVAKTFPASTAGRNAAQRLREMKP